MERNKKTARIATAEEDLQGFKDFLGPLATRYTDAQLQQLRHEMTTMAEILLDLYERGHERHKSAHFDTVTEGT